jgi:hypothetical protein
MNELEKKLRDLPVPVRPCVNCRHLRKEYFKNYKQDALREDQYRYHCDWILNVKKPIHLHIFTSQADTWIPPKMVEGPHNDEHIECECFEHK